MKRKKTTSKSSGKTTSIRLRAELEKKMDRLAKMGMNRSYIINEALSRFLLKMDLDEIREEMMPIAQSKGIYSDQDVEKLLE